MTKEQYELNQDILQSLDKIDNCVMESEISVIDSILNSYSKAVTVLEHCSDTADLSSFNIIQESFILEDGETGETGETGKDTKQQKLIIKILMFIPRMIMKFINFLKSKISAGGTTKKLIKRIDELERMSREDKSKIIELINDMKLDEQLLRNNMYDDIDDHQNQINEIKRTTDKRLNYMDDDIANIRTKSTEEIAALNSKVGKLDNTQDVLRSSIVYNDSETHKIKNIINVMNGNVYVDLDFNKIKNMYNNILHIFELLEKYNIHKPSTISSDIQKTISADKMDGVVESRLGRSGIYNLDIFTYNKDDLMKLSDFKKNLNDILEIRYKITTIGKRVSDNISSQVNGLNKSIMDKNKKIGTSQQAKLDQAKTVSDYISYYTRIVMDLEKAYEKELLIVEDYFKAIKSVHIDVAWRRT